MTRRRPQRYEAAVALRALVATLPLALAALLLVWAEPVSERLRWTVTLACGASWLALTVIVRQGVARPLHTLSNLLATAREGDFSIRGRHTRHDDALGVALDEINALADTLQRERFGALEASTLVKKAFEAIDVALFVFDADGRVTLCNHAAGRLAGQDAAALVGQPAGALGLSPLLQGETPRTMPLLVGGATRQVELRRKPLRQEGRPSSLVVVSDLSRALRDEERHAFERLVRVLGHEINNSLAPIQSIATSLKQRALRGNADPAKLASDVTRGLDVIERRAEALGRFMSSYARLLRLPPPRFARVDVGEWVRRVVELETRRPVRVAAGPAVSVRGDGDQLDQLLINLLRNAIDAATEADGDVEVGWVVADGAIVVAVRDEGPGLPETRNLFVPFFTTKPNGSGIGLVLSRQIAENHGGTLTLANRTDRRGCEARLLLPRDAAGSAPAP